MVRAILNDSKTQTRRVIHPLCELHESFCPYGQPGDRLWVRETWMPDAPRDGSWDDIGFFGCKGSPLSMIPERFRKPNHCLFRASWEGTPMAGWKPSIHMPRWASRLTLGINAVRVERLHHISEGDAIAEGIERVGKMRVTGEPFWRNYEDAHNPFTSPIKSFSPCGPRSMGAHPWRKTHGSGWSASSGWWKGVGSDPPLRLQRPHRQPRMPALRRHRAPCVAGARRRTSPPLRRLFKPPPRMSTPNHPAHCLRCGIPHPVPVTAPWNNLPPCPTCGQNDRIAFGAGPPKQKPTP